MILLLDSILSSALHAAKPRTAAAAAAVVAVAGAANLVIAVVTSVLPTLKKFRCKHDVQMAAVPVNVAEASVNQDQLANQHVRRGTADELD